jgi:hypothetical protein
MLMHRAAPAKTPVENVARIAVIIGLLSSQVCFRLTLIRFAAGRTRSMKLWGSV